MRASLIVLGALGLAACGSPEPAADNAALPPRAADDAAGTDYVGALRTMPEGQRNATLLRAIRDADRACQDVTASAERAPINDAPAWTATCEDGVTWTVIIGANGIAQVTNDQELRAAGIEK
jgi:hypothetical protein